MRFRNTSPGPVGFFYFFLMMRQSISFIFFLSLLTLSLSVSAQYKEDTTAGKELLEFEKKIDAAVVATDIAFLEKAYADDFHFKHGTGHIDDKASWLSSVQKNKGAIVSRTLDSVEVEIHKNVGITNGHLAVVRKESSYNLNYVRVYVRNNGQWQMIMHRTVGQENFSK